MYRAAQMLDLVADDVKKIIIEGVTESGRKFRPSDWAERMSGALSTFGRDQRIQYSPLLQPMTVKGIKCVAIDPRGSGILFWYDHDEKRIYRANPDGTSIQAIVGPAGISKIRALALDLDENKIYWADYDGHSIKRANLDGSFIENLTTTAGKPWGISIVPGS